MAMDDPYAAPAAPVDDPTSTVRVPDEILGKIRRGWIAAAISAGMTLLVTLLAMSGASVGSFSAWNMVDVVLIAGLAYGIRRRSRACATIMLGYFVLSKILIVVQTGKPTGVLVGLIFIYFLWQGVSGTFAYHRLLQTQRGALQDAG